MNNIAKDLIESFGYTAEVATTPGLLKTVGDTAAAGTAGWGAGKIASKVLGRAIPGVTAGLNAYDAKRRWDDGDTVGAAISGVSGALSLIPGLGVPVSLALDAVNIGRDVGSAAADYIKDKPAPANADDARKTKLKALQKIIGTKDDGMYGPATRTALIAWQQQHGLKPDGIPGPDTFTAAGLMENIMKQKTTVAEDIATLRDRLAIIENQSQYAEGVIGDLAGGAVNAAKNAFKPGAKAAATAATDAGEAGIKAATTTTADTVVDKGFSDAVKRMGVKEKDGKFWAKDPQSVGNYTEVEKVGNDFVRPNQAAGFNNSTWHANGPLAKQLDKQLAGVAPAQVEKATAEALANPAVTALEKDAIKKGGLVAWIKANPKKAAGLGVFVGLGLAGLTPVPPRPDPHVLPPGPPVLPPGPHVLPPGPPVHHSYGKYDPAVASMQQELVNRGYPIKVDGIMGPQTKKAHDYELGTGDYAGHPGAAEMDRTGKQLVKDTRPGATQPAPVTGSQAYLDQQFKNPTVVESITSLRAVLAEIENR